MDIEERRLGINNEVERIARERPIFASIERDAERRVARSALGRELDSHTLRVE